jgi:hypothetical protein
MYLFLLMGSLMVLGAMGLALGLRPSRRDFFPGRLLGTLMLYSALVALAAWALVDRDWTTRLMTWFDDPKGFLVHVSLGLIIAIGTLLLTPLWAYAAGRTVRWFRRRGTSPQVMRSSTAIRPTSTPSITIGTCSPRVNT